MGLVRLQKMYLLETHSLAKGIIDHVKYRNELSAHDCFELGIEMYYEGEFEYSQQWLNESLQRYEEYYDSKEMKRTDLLEMLALVYNATGFYYKKITR